MTIKILKGADKVYGLTEDGKRVEAGAGAALVLDLTPREDGSKPSFELQTEGPLIVDFDSDGKMRATKRLNGLVIR